MNNKLFPIFVKSGKYTDQCRAGFIDASGQIVVDPIFECAGSFREGLASVRVRSKWGLIDESGKMVIKPFSDQRISFSEGRGVFNERGKYGVIDRSGSVIVAPKYYVINDYSEGLASMATPGAATEQ